jgi:hypothetical protein
MMNGLPARATGRADHRAFRLSGMNVIEADEWSFTSRFNLPYAMLLRFAERCRERVPYAFGMNHDLRTVHANVRLRFHK